MFYCLFELYVRCVNAYVEWWKEMGQKNVYSSKFRGSVPRRPPLEEYFYSSKVYSSVYSSNRLGMDRLEMP